MTAVVDDLTWTLQESSEAGLYVSEELYWANYYHHPDYNYEWNNGYLEEKPMADYLKAAMYRWFLRILEEYLTVHPIARLTMLEIGFRMDLPDKQAVRKPDLGVVLNSNPIPMDDHDRTYHGIFDLCIESLSDSTKNEIERDTVAKYKEYALAGVQEYYILDDSGREMAFLENVGGRYQPMKAFDGVIRSRVLPGFQFRVNDLYRQPALIRLADDTVYQGFILLEYQAEKRHREREQIAKEQERLAKEQERQAKEQERQAKEQERLAKEVAQQQLLDTARNLLPLMDDATIAEITGIKVEIIRQLRGHNHNDDQ